MSDNLVCIIIIEFGDETTLPARLFCFSFFLLCLFFFSFPPSFFFDIPQASSKYAGTLQVRVVNIHFGFL